MILSPLERKSAHPFHPLVGLIPNGHSHIAAPSLYLVFSPQNVPEVLVEFYEQEPGVYLGKVFLQPEG